MSSTPASDCGWLATMPDDLAVQPGQRARSMLVAQRSWTSRRLAVVDDLLDHLAHVVRAVAVGRDQVQQRLAAPVAPGRRRGTAGGFSRLLRGQQRQQVAHLLQAGLPRRRRRSAPHRRSPACTSAPPRPFCDDLLAGDRLHHVRAGDEHLRGVADHEHEVGQRRASRPRRPRTGRASRRSAGSRPEARVLRWKIPPYPASAETPSWMRAPAPSFSDDQRRAGRDRQVHDLVDLRGVRLAQRAAEDPEVVRVDEDRPAVHRAPSR